MRKHHHHQAPGVGILSWKNDSFLFLLSLYFHLIQFINFHSFYQLNNLLVMKFFQSLESVGFHLIFFLVALNFLNQLFTHV